jgi:peptide/nickel transport system permease protein
MSIVMVTFGFWALGMRGLMITVQGEDYSTLAKAKGLQAALHPLPLHDPQRDPAADHGLRAADRGLVAGQVLVERIFAYPGMGKLLYDAILDQDFPVIQGVSFVIILMTAIAVFLVDLIYPLIDPRIRHGGS